MTIVRRTRVRCETHVTKHHRTRTVRRQRVRTVTVSTTHGPAVSRRNRGRKVTGVAASGRVRIGVTRRAVSRIDRPRRVVNTRRVRWIVTLGVVARRVADRVRTLRTDRRRHHSRLVHRCQRTVLHVTGVRTNVRNTDMRRVRRYLVTIAATDSSYYRRCEVITVITR